MILQLDPPIPVTTPKGPALAMFIIDHGTEHHLLWVCFLDDSGECWTYPNTQIRAQKNITMGRENISPLNDVGVTGCEHNWVAKGVKGYYYWMCHKCGGKHKG